MISDFQKNIIIETFMPYHPTRISIFGSYAKNLERGESDIDILYYFEKSISLIDKFRIKNLLKLKLNLNVDLVSEKAINQFMREDILSTKVEIFSDNEK